MVLTPAQITTLHNFIVNDPVLNAYPKNSDGAADMARQKLNVPFTPTFFCWKSLITEAEATVGFDWTRVDNLSVGKARIWDTMFRRGEVDPSQANIRAGVEACYSVEAADGPCRLSFYTAAQRGATVIEKLYAVGTGITTNNHGVGPNTLVFVGPVSDADVLAAL